MHNSFLELPPKIQLELFDHYLDAQPYEAVGLILKDGSILRLKNKSKDSHTFRVGLWQILWNLGLKSTFTGDGISMVYHSHQHSPEPSDVDKNFMVVLNKRWPGVDHLIYVPGLEYAIWQYKENVLSH